MKTRLVMVWVVALLGLVGCGKTDDSKVLNLYIWGEYLPQEVVDKFAAKTGIRVNVENYDSNEKLLSKIESGVAGYDLCWPTDYMVKTMIDAGLLREIKAEEVKGVENISPRFRGQPFDADNKYTVPYCWGTTGIGYNKQAIPKVDSWSVLFDEKYAGKILMLDDMRECFTVALKLAGKSLNTTDEPTLRAAADVLKKQHKILKTYNADDYDNVLAAGDVVVAHGYNGQMAKLAAKHPDKFAYVIPKEGGTKSQDCMVIPKSARHVENALAFIRYILEPEVMGEIVNAKSYASCNEAAKKFIKPEILNDPAVYPSEEQLKNCETMIALSPATRTLIDKLWTEIKSQ